MSKRRSGPKKVNVSDAAAPITMAQRFLGNAAEIIADARRRGVQPDSVVLRAQSTAHSMLTVWERSPVILRVDSEFVGALLTSETDAELTVDVLATLAFDAVAFSFETPLRLHDGTVECEYRGAIVSGASTRPTTETVTWTTYPPLSEADGFRVLWLYTQAGEVEPRVQTTTVMLTGPLGKAHTIAELIAAQLANISNLGGGYGEEMATLVPLAVLLPLCLAAAEPDLDLLAAESIGRPQQLQSSQVGNLGWRTGAALRAWREQPPAPPSGDSDATDPEPHGLPAQGGWRLPPHIRRAHWHRVRVAMRDEAGAIVGDRLGEQGVDWTYQLRLYPPTPVAAKDGVAPSVRELT